MKHFALCALVALVPAPAPAQQPTFDVSRTKPGTTYRYHAENGDTEVTYLGPDGKRGYKLAFRRDASKGSPYKMTWWVTRDGQLLRAVGPGVDDRYSPNDCSLTLGSCRYVVTAQDGSRTPYLSVTRTEGDVWHYRVYRHDASPANLIESGSFTVDRQGFTLDRDYRLRDGIRRWTRRIR